MSWNAPRLLPPPDPLLQARVGRWSIKQAGPTPVSWVPIPRAILKRTSLGRAVHDTGSPTETPHIGRPNMLAGFPIRPICFCGQSPPIPSLATPEKTKTGGPIGPMEPKASAAALPRRRGERKGNMSQTATHDGKESPGQSLPLLCAPCPPAAVPAPSPSRPIRDHGIQHG